MDYHNRNSAHKKYHIVKKLLEEYRDREKEQREKRIRNRTKKDLPRDNGKQDGFAPRN